MAKRESENTMSDLLHSFIKRNKLQIGLDKVSIKDAWYKVMGEAIGKYTTEVQLDRDTVYVRLSSSVLREELSYGREKIVRMLNEELGKELVKTLVLR